MANNSEGIKTTVGVKGDKEYKAALQQISRQLTVLNTDMKASQSAFGNQAESMDGMHDRLEKLNEIYEVQAKKVELIREQLEKAKAEYGENSKQADNLQIALNKATAQMNGTANQINQTKGDMDRLADAQAALGEEVISGSTTLKEAEQAMKDMAKETGTAAEASEEAGGAMEDAGSAAEDGAGALGALRRHWRRPRARRAAGSWTACRRCWGRWGPSAGPAWRRSRRRSTWRRTRASTRTT